MTGLPRHGVDASPTDPSVTEILRAMGRGDPGAQERLLPEVYDQLRGMARAALAQRRPHQTLQPTALVHEAYLQLVLENDRTFENRRHFFFVAARAMRDILVESARARSSQRKGGAWARIDFESIDLPGDLPHEDLLALDEALERLERDDPRKHEIVHLRFFAGLTAAEAARTLGLSLRTVERDWRYIRARLHKELADSA